MEASSQVFEFYLHHSLDFDEDLGTYDIEQSTDVSQNYVSFYDAYQAYLHRHH